MRVVVYDREDYEPLTIIHVPGHFITDYLRNREGFLKFIVRPSEAVGYSQDFGQQLGLNFGQYEVVLYFAQLYVGNTPKFWMATAADGEKALRLRSVFLPGQNYEVQQREQAAFYKGLSVALGEG